MDFALTNKVALVTGSHRGTGQIIATRLGPLAATTLLIPSLSSSLLRSIIEIVIENGQSRLLEIRIINILVSPNTLGS